MLASLLPLNIKREFGENLPEWIIVETVQDKQYQKFLETKVDIGEASAMALAKENTDRINHFGLFERAENCSEVKSGFYKDSENY